jgi:hypothetical protein
VTKALLGKGSWYPTSFGATRRFSVRAGAERWKGYLGMTYYSQKEMGGPVVSISVTILTPRRFAGSKLDDVKRFVDGAARALTQYECQWDAKHLAIFFLRRIPARSVNAALSELRRVDDLVKDLQHAKSEQPTKRNRRPR